MANLDLCPETARLANAHGSEQERRSSLSTTWGLAIERFPTAFSTTPALVALVAQGIEHRFPKWGSPLPTVQVTASSSGSAGVSCVRQ